MGPPNSAVPGARAPAENVKSHEDSSTTCNSGTFPLSSRKPAVPADQRSDELRGFLSNRKLLFGKGWGRMARREPRPELPGQGRISSMEPFGTQGDERAASTREILFAHLPPRESRPTTNDCRSGAPSFGSAPQARNKKSSPSAGIVQLVPAGYAGSASSKRRSQPACPSLN